MSNLGKTFGKIVRRRNRKSEISKTGEVAENQSSKIYLKAIPLRKLSDLDLIKREVKSGTILIIKVSPLANKSIEDIKKAINELCEFVKTVDGDIARLGEERIVITPSGVRIWREKPVASQEQVPTAA
ncbi:MAG: cell division protein SepF [Candidatus Bathyarchaeia archaeon]